MMLYDLIKNVGESFLYEVNIVVFNKTTCTPFMIDWRTTQLVVENNKIIRPLVNMAKELELEEMEHVDKNIYVNAHRQEN